MGSHDDMRTNSQVTNIEGIKVKDAQNADEIRLAEMGKLFLCINEFPLLILFCNSSFVLVFYL
jgi:hypothetical protein